MQIDFGCSWKTDITHDFLMLWAVWVHCRRAYSFLALRPQLCHSKERTTQATKRIWCNCRLHHRCSPRDESGSVVRVGVSPSSHILLGCFTHPVPWSYTKPELQQLEFVRWTKKVSEVVSRSQCELPQITSRNRLVWVPRNLHLSCTWYQQVYLRISRCISLSHHTLHMYKEPVCTLVFIK